VRHGPQQIKEQNPQKQKTKKTKKKKNPLTERKGNEQTGGHVQASGSRSDKRHLVSEKDLLFRRKPSPAT